MKSQSKIPVSVVITAFNEEAKLPDCLESVKWADEIIVINGSSTDKTVDTAKKYTPHVFTRPNYPMLNVNKNFGFSKVKNDWILSLDADERVTPELADEIISLFSQPKADPSLADNSQFPNGYWIPRKNIIFGKWIQNSIWWPDDQLRLFRTGKGKFPEIHVHEKIAIVGNTVRMNNPILHLNYETVKQFIQKMDTIYSENEVKNILESGKQLTWLDAIKMPVGDFLKTFFLQKGYKDGLHGLVLSLLQAFYAEVVFAKVWEKQGFPEHNNEQFLNNVLQELRKTADEFHYWILSVMIDSAKGKAKKLFYKTLRNRVNRRIKNK